MKLCYQLVLAALLCISQARATEWLTLSEETLPQWLQLPVTVEAIAASTVSAQTSGRIIELPYDVNDLVPQGAVIVRFSDSEQRARLQQAQASVAEALSRQQEAEKELNRTRELRQQGLVAKAALDQAIANFDAAKARTQQAQAGVAQATELLEQTVVRAPYAGIVQQRFVELGELATPGKPLIRGLSLQHLRVSGQLAQRQLVAAQHSEQAQLQLADGRVLDLGQIKPVIAPEASGGGHSYLLRLSLPEADYSQYALYPGSWQRLKLQIGSQSVLRLPRSAVIWRGEVSAVWQQLPEGVVLQQVRLQPLDPHSVQILSGLAAGAVVAADATAYASDLSQQRRTAQE
ncbi:MAG: efflux RND transporter periplasmic adaptor subunit [Chromatiaceae bacterium]|nr:efflux RND transporter periplasmic adaptor subunit [Chromatiaceae bacterium]